MNTPLPSDLRAQRDQLQKQVTSLLGHVSADQAAELEALRAPLEPELAKALHEVFHRTETGRREAERIEIDLLRRASRSETTEQIFRPYGILELVTPVRRHGKTCFAIDSGPLRVEPWSAASAETLAKLCGIRESDLPSALSETPVYSPEQIQVIATLQEQLARLVEQIPLADAPELGESEPDVDEGALELLHPGFADHLDVLFGLIQQATAQERDLPAAEVLRIHKIAERGRKLADHARRLSEQAHRDPQPQSVHRILSHWCTRLERQYPHVRFRSRLEAEEDLTVANARQLHHLVYTLLSGIVDGLPEGRALVGVSTRNEFREGRHLLHLEIRDGGGVATFAGVGGEVDRQLETEQLQAADEGAEWTALASRLNAEIRILRDTDTVTRAEVFLPLAGTVEAEAVGADAKVLWIVEDDDREVEHLLRMLRTLPITHTRFRSAAELKEKFATAATAPDLVLLKYYLPDERGAEVRSWLYEQDASLPVIMISSLDATHPGIATVNRLPATLYLQKPYDASTLLNLIHLNLDDTLSG